MTPSRLGAITVNVLACVSNRVIAQKLERKRKQKGGRGRGLLSSQLSRRTGAETLATQAIKVLDFGPLGTAMTPLQRGGFPTFATTLNSFIDIIHSTENKAIKEGTTSVYSNCYSNYKSRHVASNHYGNLHNVD